MLPVSDFSIEQLQVVDPVFFEQPDTLTLARWLLGKYLITCINGTKNHCKNNRNRGLFRYSRQSLPCLWGEKNCPHCNHVPAGGHSYVYLCYGLHHMFNIVTHAAGEPHAILIRAGEPVAGMETMLKRRQKSKIDYSLTRGPGALAQALG